MEIEVSKKISSLIKNHKHKDFHEIYGYEEHEWQELGIKRIKVKYIKEESIDNLKQGSLEYFNKLISSNKRTLFYLLDICKVELKLIKIKGKREYWCCGSGNNRPFFIKHFGHLINRDWIYADVDEMTPVRQIQKSI